MDLLDPDLLALLVLLVRLDPDLLDLQRMEIALILSSLELPTLRAMTLFQPLLLCRRFMILSDEEIEQLSYIEDIEIPSFV